MIDRTPTADVKGGVDEVTVGGHVHEIRDLGGVVFVIIRDHSGIIQLVFKKERDQKLLNRALSLGSEYVVSITGEAVENEQSPGGVEILPTSLDVISGANPQLPLEISRDVNADLFTRFDHRSLDLRKPEVMAVFSLRSKLVTAMEGWFAEQGYVDIKTPRISKGGAEGGADLSPIVYYDTEAYLSQSPQLYKQILMAAGYERIYQKGTAFRAEDFAASRHVSEIAMFDVELAFIEDHHDVMDVQEQSLQHVLQTAATEATTELEKLGVDLHVPEEPFPRITFTEALTILETEFGHEPADASDLDTKGKKLLDQHFEEQGSPAFFVVGYPDEKFYYMHDVPGDDVSSRKFDLIYKGQELSSGGQREHSVDKMLKTMREEGIDISAFNFYVEAIRCGVPPHGAYGLGIDRLVQKVAGLDNIKEAILFPRDPNRLVP